MGDHTLGTALLAAVTLVGCYGARSATRDANDAWRGRSRVALEARWGTAATTDTVDGVTTLTWSRSRHHVTLPSARGHLKVDDGEVDLYAEVRPGAITKSSTIVTARVDAAGTILSVVGPSLRWGAPRGLNLRWGLVMGAHAAMGRLDDTSTPLPGGGLYIGGMLSRTLALVGTFSLTAGIDDDGGALGLVWGLAPQWWPTARANLRLGPAAMLAFDPGFDNGGFEPAVAGAASYAFVRAGKLVLDLRLDVAAGTSTTLGTVGIGIHRN